MRPMANALIALNSLGKLQLPGRGRLTALELGSEGADSIRN